MTRSTSPAPFPSNTQILEFIKDSPGRVGKREIARAFHLDSEQKLKLKKVLRKLKDEGQLQANRKNFADPAHLPNVTVLEVSGLDVDGELLARPVVWENKQPPPTIYMAPARRGQNALGIGDRVLAKMTKIENTDDGRIAYEGHTIRRLEQAPGDVLGVFLPDEGGPPRLRATDRRVKKHFIVSDTDAFQPEKGDLFRAEVLPGKKLGLRHVKLREKVSRTGPKSISMIAIYDRSIPVDFTAEALQQAKDAKAAPLNGREDLRKVPLITIDGEDARDFDDAVFSEPDTHPDNPGGWHIIVAIADVSWYVRPGDDLDVEAYKRGNSVYFPDRVVPMLPEDLSNGWCSLRPHEDRPTIVAHMWIDKLGQLIRHEFKRALIHSAARTTYTQIQAARNGQPEDVTGPLMDSVIPNLYGAYESLSKNRATRGVLELDLPERQILLDDDANVLGVKVRERFDSHKLIEEFMILANVAAAQTLEKHKQPCMYRIHDEPSVEKIEALKEFLDSISIPFDKGQVIRAGLFNQILKKAHGTPNSHMVSEVVLRSQAQAEYNPANVGHFGLALLKYCHFTSPIRRYADLLVHRALVRGLNLGEGPLEDDHKDFEEIGEHLSVTERNASGAERDATDRFAALYLSEKVGQTLPGRINGVTRFGLFVTMDESGADGLVPIRTLGDDFYIHDENTHTLRGRETGFTYRLGDNVEVLISEADPITGSTVFQMMSGGTPGKPQKRGSGKGKFKGNTDGRKPLKRKGKNRASRRKNRSS